MSAQSIRLNNTAALFGPLLKLASKRLWLHVGAAATLTALAACSDPNAAQRQSLMSELKAADGKYSLAVQDLSERKDKIALLEQQLEQQKADLADYKGQVQAYMMDHKMAVAAIVGGAGGLAVAIDPNNEFSDSAKGLGILGALVAIAYYSEHSDEVNEVADKLTQAGAYANKLEREISSNANALQEENSLLDQEEADLSALNADSARLRSELNALS